jgi:hypothetical protein
MNRLRVHEQDAMKGRLFIQFIAQILAGGVRSIMISSGLIEKLTVQELMNELKSLDKVIIEGSKKTVLTKPTKLQREIFEAFKVNWDSSGV